MNRSACWTMLALLFGSLMVMGCGERSPMPTVPVSGTVTYDGQPVAGAEVVFMTEGAPRAAGGRTDAQGMYRLMTFKENDGAIVGTHTVTISKSEEDLSGMDAASPDADYGAAMAAVASGGPSTTGMRGGIPAKYGDPKTSDLTAVVTDDGPKVIDFELE